MQSELPEKGITQALAEAYEQHGSQLFAYARTITGDPTRAQDVVHDAVLSVAKTKSVPRDIKAYLFRAVRNRAYRIQVVEARERQLTKADLAVFFEDPSVDDPVQRRIALEEQARCVRALEDLDPNERETITLHLFGDFKFREIADLTQTPIGTVASRYRRGLAKLAVLLQDQSHEGKKACAPIHLNET